MRRISSLSFTPSVCKWLEESRSPRILHVFDTARNLINEQRDILSIVTPQIGNGPFNLVVEEGILFSEQIDIATPISVSRDQIMFGELAIETRGAKLWNPEPDWMLLHIKKEELAEYLLRLATHHPWPTIQLPESLVSSLATALVSADISLARTVTSKLAGLGMGLTPSGDDVLMGALYAAWIIHPHEIASRLGREVAGVVVPLTTSLSAAWLRSAGRGEAGILWHEFFAALISADGARSEQAMDRIKAVGETSGTDALAGFLHTFVGYTERMAAAD